MVKKRTFQLSGAGRSTLHAKVMVFDRTDVFIGSLNLDPSSGDINTEADFYREPEVSRPGDRPHGRRGLPDNTCRVLLDAEGNLYWLTETDGKTERYDQDSNSTAWQRAKVRFIGMLPVMDQW